MEIRTRNTNTLMNQAYSTLVKYGVSSPSRNGPVLRITEPVLFHITHPWERVNFSPDRDANPFFHLIEAAAMLAGVNNIQFLAHFAKQMLEYSDDGKTQNAFYGTRLRSKLLVGGSFCYVDQLSRIIFNLHRNPNSRQEVAIIWEAEDLVRSTKDKACNLALLFSIDSGDQVTMTSLNRSNDAIWGFVSGANMVHLSYFHEYVACGLGRAMGSWWHLSNNFHVYTNNPKWDVLKQCVTTADMYTTACDFGPRYNLFVVPQDRMLFDISLQEAFRQMLFHYPRPGECVDEEGQLFQKWVHDVVHVFNTWQHHKAKNVDGVRTNLFKITAGDWRYACYEWMRRRHPEL